MEYSELAEPGEDGHEVEAEQAEYSELAEVNEEVGLVEVEEQESLHQQ